MKRTRAQNPKAQDTEPQDPAAAAAGSNPNPKPQRRAKQPRQPKAGATGGKKTAAAREAAAVAATAAAAASSIAVASPAADMAPVVPDVCVAGVGGAGEVACGLPAEWDEMDGSPWWTFGVEEEKLLGWFPFVEEDFLSVGGGAGPAAAEPFDDDIWRIHQIYEIPSYAAK
ncbi:uncharacterized protein LOC119274495 [Triticum dicoccoides]|uniref:uncharacterized protein LOC119274495 n=1 Tax=Triticum dicoccoides TaxID=85692 RepID=UPI00188EA4BE|nr:uncharacterized protein LOC119274495 [Triticum dicoccoides]